MPAGFFSTSDTTQSLHLNYSVARCGACKLYKSCQSPKMEPTGKGRRKILIVGEAPGRNEDDQGRQLCGKSGRKLEHILSSVGIDMRRDCWLTNAIICHPKGNRTPSDKELRYCHPNLRKTIDRLKPEIIVPIGGRAVWSVLQGLWREDIGEIGRWVGWKIPNRKPNAWICPTWHPSYVGRQEDPALDLWWKKHLKAIAKLEGRPWKTVPDEASQVEVIFDPDKAARRIRSMMLLGNPAAAFDYETNMLKPDGSDAEIVCCSISWEGRTTIAYPWAGEAIEATREFIRSKAKKIASNAKFEERWTRRILGCRVRNWWWDTMLMAHVCDNRRGITSVKFQGFVRRGLPIYDAHIKPYLVSKGTGTPNRIKEVDLGKLLIYCGVDSKIEWDVAMLQRKELGYERP